MRDLFIISEVNSSTWDASIGAWRVDALLLPGGELTVFVRGAVVHQDSYERNGQWLRWRGADRPQDSISVQIRVANNLTTLELQKLTLEEQRAEHAAEMDKQRYSLETQKQRHKEALDGRQQAIQRTKLWTGVITALAAGPLGGAVAYGVTHPPPKPSDERSVPKLSPAVPANTPVKLICPSSRHWLPTKMDFDGRAEPLDYNQCSLGLPTRVTDKTTVALDHAVYQLSDGEEGHRRLAVGDRRRVELIPKRSIKMHAKLQLQQTVNCRGVKSTEGKVECKPSRVTIDYERSFNEISAPLQLVIGNCSYDVGPTASDQMFVTDGALTWDRELNLQNGLCVRGSRPTPLPLPLPPLPKDCEQARKAAQEECASAPQDPVRFRNHFLNSCDKYSEKKAAECSG